jgi:hypothetical protein
MMGRNGIADKQARNKQHHLIDRSGDVGRRKAAGVAGGTLI